MHQIQELCFDVMFSSSLPPFPGTFTANALNYLELGCREDNGASLDVWEPVTPTAPEQQYPSLWSLLIDGCVFSGSSSYYSLGFC
jgi:hypothetical protein